LILDQKFWCEGLFGFNKQIFSADGQNPGGQSDQGMFGPQSPMHSWDQMKPRTVYEKAVQDFTETAQQLARLEQHFRQASFAEFKMLMAFDDEVLKRYGLPKRMVERALIEVYETVVLGQERNRDHS
jgi:hypothetical protein